jgi:hypothetical protein
LVVDGRGLPLVLEVTAGNINDSTVFEQVIEKIHIARPDGGRPRPGQTVCWPTRATRQDAFTATCAAAGSAV